MSKNGQRSFWIPEYVFSILLTVAMVALWEWLVRAGKVSALFFPAPSTIVRTSLRLISAGELTPHLKATLYRVGLGGVIGAAAGVALGVLMGWSCRIRNIVDPFVAAIHPIPKIAVFPVVMVIFGIGETSRVLVVAIAAFFPILINTVLGVRQINPRYFEVAANYNAGPVQVLRRVIVPGSLPFVLAGLRIGGNVAFLMTIAVEMVGVETGLGKMIWFSWETLRTENLYVCLGIIAILGIGFNAVLYFLSLRFCHWQIDRGDNETR